MNLFKIILCFGLWGLPSMDSLNADPLDTVRLEAPELANVFAVGEPLRFLVITSKAKAATEVSWRILNWRRQEVSNGKARLGGGAPVTFPKLPRGYFTVEFEPAGAGVVPISLAVVASPDTSDSGDLPFALDTGFSWLTDRGPYSIYTSSTDRAAAAVRLLRLSGARHVRERLQWSETNPRRGQFVWNKYRPNAELLFKNGIRVLDVYHEAPGWTKKDLVSLPRDLVALSQFAEAAARDLAPAVTDWEFWNEPDDTSYCADAAWDFASAQKAAYYGFKLGNPRARILSSAAAIVPSSFFDVVLRNSGGASFDSFNVHLYEPVANYQRLLEQARRSLQDSGLGQFPIWVSEVGLAQEGSGKVALPQSPWRREHDSAQELEQAVFLVKSLVTLASLGAERIFFFILFPYNEGNGAKVWGMLRWDWTPKPAYCAFSNLVHQLGGMHWSGRLDLGDDVDAFVWSAAPSHSQNQTVVIWSRARKNVYLASATAASRSVDLMGTESPLVFNEKGAIIEASPEPQFVTQISGLTRSSIWLTQSDVDAGIKASSPVVLSLESPAANIKNRIAVRIDGSVQWPLNVWNLSSHEQHIELQNHSRGVAARGLPERLTIGPIQKKTIQVALAPEHATGDNAQISFAGTTRNGKIAPVTIPLYPSRLSIQERPRLKVDINDPRSWRANSSGKMSASAAAKKDHVSFAVTFPAEVADRWIYPEFALASSRSAMMASSGVSFEIKQNTRESGLVRKAYLILVDEKGEKHFMPIEVTANWQQMMALWRYDAPITFNPAKAVALQIGCNPTSNQFEYSVRNLEIIAAPSAQHAL